VHITTPRACFRNHASIGRTNDRKRTSDSIHREARTGMTEREKRLAKEREEIAARVASFKAMQQKFEREREEFCRATLRNAREGKQLRTWS
jgi:hypothetical protein